MIVLILLLVRTRYTPAAAHLEQILALTSKSPEDIKTELCLLHDDIGMSLALLQEADMLISTRLNLYKRTFFVA